MASSTSVQLLSSPVRRDRRRGLSIHLGAILVACLVANTQVDSLARAWLWAGDQLSSPGGASSTTRHGAPSRHRPDSSSPTRLAHASPSLSMIRSCTPLLSVVEEQLQRVRSQLHETEARLRHIEVERDRLRTMTKRQQLALTESHGGSTSQAPSTSAATGTGKGTSRPGPGFHQRVGHSDPILGFLGSDIWITGTVMNRGSQTEQPLVLVELLRDGRVEGRDSRRITVPAGATAPYEFRIPTGLQEGNYTANVRLEM